MFEQPAQSLDDAASQCRTGYYWYIYGDNDYSEFDFDYVPAPWESTHVHAWPTQWNQYGGAYLAHSDSASDRKWQFHSNIVPIKSNDTLFNQLQLHNEFDFTWRPHPFDPPYIYVFGNQWHSPEVMPSVEYSVAGATERKFIHDPKMQLAQQHTANWRMLVDCEWDYSWIPDPGDPPYIYVFGNQWHSPEVMPTVEYSVAGATEIKYMDYPRAILLQNTTLWSVPEELNADTIDFSWVPDPGSPPFVYHFGSDYQQSIGLTYVVPAATELRFEGKIPTKGDLSKDAAMQVLDIFYIDRGNPTAQTRYDRLSEMHKVTKVRYANSMMDTIKRCVNRAKTNKFWVISSEYSYSDFDFRWHAEPWQSYMTHVFPSQHNKWSDTFLFNKYEFDRHAKWANSLEEFPNLNFVTDQRVVKPENLHNIYFVDHNNPEGKLQYDLLKESYPDLIATRFVNNYLDTFKRIMSTADTEYVWILSSICDYSYFDLTWQPEPWQKEMIHCFSNQNSIEKRGDTFYINVESFKAQMIELELLDWFNVINYCEAPRVTRLAIPLVSYHGSDLITAIRDYTFTTPYAVFTKDEADTYPLKVTTSTCMWAEKDRVATPLTGDKSSTIVPRDIKKYIKTQVYDYPYLASTKRTMKVSDQLDIVYISNGEPDEQKWFEWTQYQSNRDVKWIRGVNGRTAAYQQAARQSDTEWFLAVFAKLEVNGLREVWEFMPDYWQEPKHYIFNAQNPVNGLVYGHQGIIAYNKSLVLANNDPGIDFTLSQPHESVPILSGIAHYNQDAWMTWRTAFREVLKLRLSMDTQPTLETEHRLNVWLTTAEGNFAAECLRGAADAVEYYESVNGDYELLKLSFDWQWLRDYYEKNF